LTAEPSASFAEYYTELGNPTQAFSRNWGNALSRGRHFVFSNILEVASKSGPYEKVAVAQNVKYVIETFRAEGTSPWFAADHDEAAIVLDSEIETLLYQRC